jgi:DNA-binding Lrp family transcriptional regulator
MFDEIDKKLIKELQEDIPLYSRAYEIIAAKIGISEDELLKRTKFLVDNGIIRRFGALLNHRKVGFHSNAMVVWEVPIERIQEVGKIMSSFSEVSHCYQRPVLDKWPYNLYTMIHSSTKVECEEIIGKISQKAQINKFEILYSLTELKKTSAKYFANENTEEVNA